MNPLNKATGRKKKSPLPTPEERKAMDLKHHRDEYQSEPTIIYKVGDRVIHGNIDVSHVAEVYDGGRILYLHQTCTDGNYGNPYQYERDMFVSWHEVIPFRTWDKSERITDPKYCGLHFYQSMLWGLVHTTYHTGIDMDPEYQRGFVWTLEDKRALIDSIFNNVDIGKFVLASRPYKDGEKGFEIIDGKQRLSAIKEFFEGRFTWRGLLFWDLHPMDQHHIRDYPISRAELTEPTREKILDCFLRLNTGGRPQDPKHLKKVQKLLEDSNG